MKKDDSGTDSKDLSRVLEKCFCSIDQFNSQLQAASVTDGLYAIASALSEIAEAIHSFRVQQGQLAEAEEEKKMGAENAQGL